MVQPEESLKNDIAVVTGASSGIGRAIALALAGQGSVMCLTARRRYALEAVCAEVRAAGGRASYCCADFTRDEDIRALAETVRTNFGRVDVLVLCGGAFFQGRLESEPLEQFDLLYRTHLRGHFAVIQALLPLIRKQRGQIVFINSSAGLRSPPLGGLYAATQHAVRAMADSLRDEVNGDGIRVLSVYPGRTATPLMTALFETEGRAYHPELLLQPEDIAAIVIRALTMPRTAEVTDVSLRPMQRSY